MVKGKYCISVESLMMSRLFGFVSQQVSITILDENDNSPVFDITSDTSVDIAENTPMGKKVAVVLGRDKDAGLNGLVRMVLQHGPNNVHLRCCTL